MHNTPKHTPGPWVVECDKFIATPDAIVITELNDGLRGECPKSGHFNANAQLIAAAPAMYEALALVAAEYAKDRYEHDNGCNIFYSNGMCDCTRVKVRAALAQAEGAHHE